jgi:YebC/PmpR family DNA-binding regulatory protein
MSGHSQFKNIMHRKGAQDAKRAKVFTKLVKEIVVSARQGPLDPSFNPRLRTAVLAARAANVPRDNIDRAIRKAARSVDNTDYTEVRYEGYGPAGAAIIVEALTDNRNRTTAEVRSLLTKFGGSLGETNSVSFMFRRAGEILYPTSIAESELVFEVAIEAGAENVELGKLGEQSYIVTTAAGNFATVRSALEQHFGPPDSAELTWKPVSTINVSGESALVLLKLLDALEDNDDVQRISVNFQISDAVESATSDVN